MSSAELKPSAVEFVPDCGASPFVPSQVPAAKPLEALAPGDVTDSRKYLPCVTFVTKGSCRYEDRCLFSHTMPSYKEVARMRRVASARVRAAEAKLAAEAAEAEIRAAKAKAEALALAPPMDAQFASSPAKQITKEPEASPAAAPKSEWVKVVAKTPEPVQAPEPVEAPKPESVPAPVAAPSEVAVAVAVAESDSSSTDNSTPRPESRPKSLGGSLKRDVRARRNKDAPTLKYSVDFLRSLWAKFEENPPACAPRFEVAPTTLAKMQAMGTSTYMSKKKKDRGQQRNERSSAWSAKSPVASPEKRLAPRQTEDPASASAEDSDRVTPPMTSTPVPSCDANPEPSPLSKSAKPQAEKPVGLADLAMPESINAASLSCAATPHQDDMVAPGKSLTEALPAVASC